jgi:hypothetical protein
VTMRLVVFLGMIVIAGVAPRNVREAKSASGRAIRMVAAFPGGILAGHASTLVSEEQAVYVFGGVTDSGQVTLQNNLWRYYLRTDRWELVIPSGERPQPRYFSALTHDSERNVLILFGGTSSRGCQSDLWEFSIQDNSWKLVTPTGAMPGARESAGIVFDNETHLSWLLFGNCGATEPYRSYLSYDSRARTWTRFMPPSDRPAGRTAHATVWDSKRGRVLIYGGISPAGASPTGGAESEYLQPNGWFPDLRSTWALNPSDMTWTQIGDTTGARERSWGVGAYDAWSDLLLYYGGIYTGRDLPRSDIASDELRIFELERRAWSEAPIGGGLERIVAGGAYCPCEGQLFVFGGKDRYLASAPIRGDAFLIPIEEQGLFTWSPGKGGLTDRARSGVLTLEDEATRHVRRSIQQVRLSNCRTGAEIARAERVQGLGGNRFRVWFPNVEAKDSEEDLVVTGSIVGQAIGFLARVGGRHAVRGSHEGFAPVDVEPQGELEGANGIAVTTEIHDIRISYSGPGEPRGRVWFVDVRGRVCGVFPLDLPSGGSGKGSWTIAKRDLKSSSAGLYFIVVRIAGAEYRGKVVL